MRRRIFWLTAATTSAVVLSFVVPLCLLVRAIAEDRALAEAEQESRNVAVLVSGLGTDPQIGRLIAAVDQRSAASTSVVTPDGQVLGRPVPAAAGAAGAADLRRARAGEAFTARDAQGARILVPIVTGDGTFVVRTDVPRAALHRGVTRAWVSIAALGLVLLALALLVATRLGRRVSTPVTELAAVAHRLREGDLDARAVPRGGQETVELGVALNRLAERIRELLEAERASVGDLSHRLRTPVTALRLDADAVHDPELADRLLTHVGQLQRTIDAVVRDARRPVRADHGLPVRRDRGDPGPGDVLVRARRGPGARAHGATGRRAPAGGAGRLRPQRRDRRAGRQRLRAHPGGHRVRDHHGDSRDDGRRLGDRPGTGRPGRPAAVGRPGGLLRPGPADRPADAGRRRR